MLESVVPKRVEVEFDVVSLDAGAFLVAQPVPDVVGLAYQGKGAFQYEVFSFQ